MALVIFFLASVLTTVITPTLLSHDKEENVNKIMIALIVADLFLAFSIAYNYIY
jgi:hypothetical protein